jgi:DNA topoisomerase IB
MVDTRTQRSIVSSSVRTVAESCEIFLQWYVNIVVFQICLFAIVYSLKKGTELKLKEAAEEIMTFYARMLDHDYTAKEVFNTNFMKDWRKSMTQAERDVIKDIRKCDFKQVAQYFKEQTEQKKAMSKEEKKSIKDTNEKIRKEYGYCMWDKHRQPVGNYKIEPPGLFRGRGEHPKMGCVKRRIRPQDVIINIGHKAQIPKPPEGHRWKEVRHDDKVSWLVMWTENILGNKKYIMLNASSRVKVRFISLSNDVESIIDTRHEHSSYYQMNLSTMLNSHHSTSLICSVRLMSISISIGVESYLRYARARVIFSCTIIGHR